MKKAIRAILAWTFLLGVHGKVSKCPEPWLSISNNEGHPQREEATLMCLLLTSVQIEGTRQQFTLPGDPEALDEANHRKQLKTPDSNTLRDLISVDDDYVAEHEAKIMKEADLQQKILESVEHLKLQIKQLRTIQTEENNLATTAAKHKLNHNLSEFMSRLRQHQQQRFAHGGHLQEGLGGPLETGFESGLRHSITISPKQWVN